MLSTIDQSGLSQSRILTPVNQPAGAVLQVVQVVKTDIFTTTSTSWVGISGLAATITPTSATSKILVRFSVNAGIGGNAGALRLHRDGSVLTGFIGDAVSGISTQAVFNVYNNGDNNSMFGWSSEYLDSPASLVSRTYQPYVACVQGGGTIVVNDMTSQARGTSYSMSGVSSITLMEIAG